jgi:HD-like signal output (HDOD) protein
MPESSSFSRERLFEIARSLPAAPKVLARLGALIQDLNTGLDEIAELIKMDPALSARIVRMSNSIVYGGRSIGDIEEAVNRVGFREVHRLVGVVTTERLSDRFLRFYGLEPQRMREHMLCTAISAEALADNCNIPPHSAYIAGLLRPLGMLVLDRAAEHLTACEPYDHGKFGAYMPWEGICFGLPNTEVASMLLHDWRFPSDICDGVREHYLNHEDYLGNRMAVLLNLAGSIVAEQGLTLPGDRSFWQVDAGKLNALGITEDLRQHSLRRAEYRFTLLRGSLA